MGNKLKIGFIGFGNMAKALYQGFCRTGKESWQIFAASPSLKEGLREDGIFVCSDNPKLAAQVDLIILAVKPQQMAAVLAEIKSELPANTLLISVASGLSLSWLAQHCPPGQQIIRAMPNIAVAYGQGATPLIANDCVSETQKTLISNLFNPLGLTVFIDDESLMDKFTALSGSGPAYVFLFLESLIKGAEKLGMNRDLAEKFGQQTLRSALSVLENSNLRPEQARAKVTSPKGTTAAALGILEKAGFEDLIFKALEAAFLRAKELADQVKKS